MSNQVNSLPELLSDNLDYFLRGKVSHAVPSIYDIASSLPSQTRHPDMTGWGLDTLTTHIYDLLSDIPFVFVLRSDNTVDICSFSYEGAKTLMSQKHFIERVQNRFHRGYLYGVIYPKATFNSCSGVCLGQPELYRSYVKADHVYLPDAVFTVQHALRNSVAKGSFCLDGFHLTGMGLSPNPLQLYISQFTLTGGAFSSVNILRGHKVTEEVVHNSLSDVYAKLWLIHIYLTADDIKRTVLLEKARTHFSQIFSTDFLHILRGCRLPDVLVFIETFPDLSDLAGYTAFCNTKVTVPSDSEGFYKLLSVSVCAVNYHIKGVMKTVYVTNNVKYLHSVYGANYPAQYESEHFRKLCAARAAISGKGLECVSKVYGVSLLQGDVSSLAEEYNNLIKKELNTGCITARTLWGVPGGKGLYVMLNLVNIDSVRYL